AMVTRARAVAWLRTHKREREWIPEGPRYRVLISEGGPRDCLHGIETEALVRAFGEGLALRRHFPSSTPRIRVVGAARKSASSRSRAGSSIAGIGCRSSRLRKRRSPKRGA